MRKGRGGPDPRREAPDLHLFRDEVRDVRPMAPVNRVVHEAPKPRPLPAQRAQDERAVLDELMSMAKRGRDPIGDDDVEIEDDASFLRPGLPREILRRLRRTHWVIQATLDLHGLTADEAAAETAAFLAACRREGRRCVRIVHGKGLRSPGREPVLKRRIRKLLTRRDEVLAFAEPRALQGGSGAVVVLLQG